MSDTINSEIKDNIISAIPELLECPICFNNIVDNDSFYIMICCKNKVHLQCLIEWYSTNPKSSTCFMCTQPNNFYTNFFDNHNTNDSSNNINELSNAIIELTEPNNYTNINTYNNLSTPILNRENTSNNRSCSCIGCICFIISMLILC